MKEMGITKVHYTQKTKRKGVSNHVNLLARHIGYVSFEQTAEKKSIRTQWYDENYTADSIKGATTWTKVKGRRHPFAYRIILSAQTEKLTAREFLEIFMKVDQAHENQYGKHGIRFGLHTDTDNHHVHLLCFADKKIDTPHFNSWNSMARHEIVIAEQAHRWQEESAEKPSKQKYKDCTNITSQELLNISNIQKSH